MDGWPYQRAMKRNGALDCGARPLHIAGNRNRRAPWLASPSRIGKSSARYKRAALERFCGRVLDEIVHLRADTRKTQHERYLAIYRLIQQRDRELARAFDSPRRSAALLQIAALRRLGVITDEEFARFSAHARREVESLLRLGSQ